MNIGKKLMFGFGVLAALLVGFGAYSMAMIERMADHNNIAYVQTKKLTQAAELNNLADAMGTAERDILIGSLTNDFNETRKSIEDVAQAQASFRRVLADLRPRLLTDRGRNAAATLEADLNRWMPIHAEVGRLASAGKGQEAGRLRVERSEPLLDAMDKQTDELQQAVEEVQAASAKAAEAAAVWSRWATGAIIGLSLAVSAAALFTVRGIVVQLRRMASDLGRGAEQVAIAAAQVSASSQALAQGASEQAASLEETSASSEEINSMARKNTEASDSAADLVAASQQKFVEANRSLEQTVIAMGDINAQSGKIAKIIKTIDEIAFQTNILALNAAVEAARAGEAGMGFAVVADEVRGLAHRCAQAAKDTSDLIEESIAKSNDGKTKVDQVAAEIRAVTRESDRIRTLVSQVNLGSQEQSRGIEQVAKAILQMDAVTQKTAAGAEESATAADELTAQSNRMRDVVNGLIAMVGVGDGEPQGGRHSLAA